MAVPATAVGRNSALPISFRDRRNRPPSAARPPLLVVLLPPWQPWNHIPANAITLIHSMHCIHPIGPPWSLLLPPPPPPHYQATTTTTPTTTTIIDHCHSIHPSSPAYYPMASRTSSFPIGPPPIDSRHTYKSFRVPPTNCTPSRVLPT